MLQNRSIAHNFVYGINPGSRSGNMFWENNRDNSRSIYSYGHHFCIARIYPDKNICLFTTATYSNTTSKHVAYTRGAIPCNYDMIYCIDPEGSYLANINAYIREINAAVKKLSIARKPDIYRGEINSIYKQALKYAAFRGLKKSEIKELDKAYKSQDNQRVLNAFRKQNAKELEARKAAALQRAIEKDEQRKQYEARRRSYSMTKEERLTKWENGEAVYLNYSDMENNVPLRVITRKNYTCIETGKGVFIPLPEAARVANIVLSGNIDGLTVNGVFRLLYHDETTVKIGCHTFSLEYLKHFANKVLTL